MECIWGASSDVRERRARPRGGASTPTFKTVQSSHCHSAASCCDDATFLETSVQPPGRRPALLRSRVSWAHWPNACAGCGVAPNVADFPRTTDRPSRRGVSATASPEAAPTRAAPTPACSSSISTTAPPRASSRATSTLRVYTRATARPTEAPSPSPYFVPGLPHILRIELRQALISYHEDHLLLPPRVGTELCTVVEAMCPSSTLEFASCCVRRALLMPQVHPGSLYRCGRST